MSKTLKIFSIFLIIFSLLISCYSVYATDIDMNLVPEQPTTEEPTQDANSTTNEDTTVDTANPSDSESSVNPSGVGSVAEEGLGLSNILSILLITVGVILILLSIAIIIRLK